MQYQQQQQQQQQFPNPLINAVRRNDVDLIKRLLSNGADAKATNNNGETALMYAARKGDERMVEILLPKSDAKATNWRKETAYDLAKKYQRNQIVRLLQQYQVSLISES